jgi:serine-type D-Ala-D-Ala carboxypeptidase (penicillin-binding protein 5/6)
VAPAVARRASARRFAWLVAVAALVVLGGRAAAASTPTAAASTTTATSSTPTAAASTPTATKSTPTATTPAAAPTKPPPASAPAAPALGVKAAALIEASTGQMLYGENSDAQLPIASATKLMTALVTLHHTRLSQMFADPLFYPAAEDSQIHLVPGEQMSVHDLLIAMMLPSADDAAEDLAFNVGHRSVPRFLAMMNARARQLGLTHTHYTTPIGLDTDGNYSSAGDLVTLARYVLRTEPFFRAVVRLPRYTLRTGNHPRDVVNLNDLVAKHSWINGVKTGHTLDAGYVLVVSGTQGGMTLIGAVLGAPSEAGRDASALALLNYGFANFQLRTPVHAGVVLARPAVTDKPQAHVRLVATQTYTSVFPRSAKVKLRVRAPAQLKGPLPRGTVVGSVQVLDGHKVLKRIPLRLASAVPEVKVSTAMGSVVLLSVTLLGLVVAVGAAIGLTMFWREWHRG